MRKLQIITDSCSDLTPELMERYHIDYAQMNTVYEGRTAPADLAWNEQDVHNFYNIMREGGRITTTQVPVEEFNRIFRKYLDEDCDIVYIGCSLKQSGSVNTASMLAKKLTEEYPGSTIRCINSLRASMGIGMLAIEAAKFAENCTTADETADYISTKLNNVHEFCTVNTLDHLKRAGRIKASSAFFGNLLGVKPIIVADADGEQAAYKKIKGRLSSLSEIVALLQEHITEAEKQTVYLAHADCNREEIDELKEMIHRRIPCKDIYTGYIGPIIGASIGPDAVAVFAFGDEQTFRIGEK
ncbi:MAG: DegV family protein [Clostridia bacterium]|nr:DegV family protein [Clostridia bacterium]